MCAHVQTLWGVFVLLILCLYLYFKACLILLHTLVLLLFVDPFKVISLFVFVNSMILKDDFKNT